MNSSMCQADVSTHLKIIATALFAAAVVIWIGIASSTSNTVSVTATTQRSMIGAADGHRR